ncbi:MAG: DUF4437 domain-containing protein [Bacteroidota bacterium]
MERWMPTGSFWTQPAGAPHITAAKGEENIAYVEIDRGPYLVKPTTEAFDNGERPVNVDIRNMVWLDASKTQLIQSSQAELKPAIAFLWEENDLAGYLLKFPEGFSGNIACDGDVFHAVLISGTVNYTMPFTSEILLLDPGSYFTSDNQAKHFFTVNQESDVLIYIRTNGKLRVE